MEKRVPVWHPHVRDSSWKKGGSIIGGVYLDLYAREGKRGGAWTERLPRPPPIYHRR